MADPAVPVESYLEQLERLKTARDALVYVASHPTRHGDRLLRALVEYRRLSEGATG